MFEIKNFNGTINTATGRRVEWNVQGDMDTLCIDTDGWRIEEIMHALRLLDGKVRPETILGARRARKATKKAVATPTTEPAAVAASVQHAVKATTPAPEAAPKMRGKRSKIELYSAPGVLLSDATREQMLDEIEAFRPGKGRAKYGEKDDAAVLSFVRYCHRRVKDGKWAPPGGVSSAPVPEPEPAPEPAVDTMADEIAAAVDPPAPAPVPEPQGDSSLPVDQLPDGLRVAKRLRDVVQFAMSNGADDEVALFAKLNEYAKHPAVARAKATNEFASRVKAVYATLANAG